MRNSLVSGGWYWEEVRKQRRGSTRDVASMSLSGFFQYPYIPAHITKPKEHKKLFLVQLQEKGKLFCFWRQLSKNVCRIISRTLLCGVFFWSSSHFWIYCKTRNTYHVYTESPSFSHRCASHATGEKICLEHKIPDYSVFNNCLAADIDFPHWDKLKIVGDRWIDFF